MRRKTTAAATLISGCLALAGCLQTKSEVNVKPVDINLNITGRLELVITDARKEEQQITGAAPKRTVRPEDIGLPAASAPTSEAGRGAAIARSHAQLPRLMLIADLNLVADHSDSEDQLIQRMAARHTQIAAMLDSQLVGERHAGFLAARGSVTPKQQALVDAENADRTELYKIEADAKNSTPDQVGLAYMARLEHVNKGNWVEHYNKATASWDWSQWDR